MIAPPPLELLSTAWLPYVAATFQRAQLLFRLVPDLRPTSWFRDVAANVAAGGDAESQHLFALAVDGIGSRDALRRALVIAPGLGLIPVHEGDHVHVQLFPAGALGRVGVQFPS